MRRIDRIEQRQATLRVAPVERFARGAPSIGGTDGEARVRRRGEEETVGGVLLKIGGFHGECQKSHSQLDSHLKS
jgi:hypothetical protein